ncbi:MAG: shikimate dehydrogenase [Thermoleophilaceae bacterium]|nr:shikimate dehydrogenase [Thermoleophilaceae bacterium]
MTALAGVLGHPVAHSRSPAMHNAAYADLGLDWRYVKLPVPPELFEETVRALPASGYRGANVTIPHKVAALGLADSATEAARGSGAANTLTFTAEGAIEADNTDASGFLDALEHDPEGARAVILGAGGAARAVAWALREAFAAEVAVWNRTPERAIALADELKLTPVELFDPQDYDLLVNATSIGLDAADSEADLPLTGAPPGTVVDLVYSARGTTPVIEWASRGGVRTIDGLEILVRQGARSFEIWTGHAPSLEVMRTAALG